MAGPVRVGRFLAEGDIRMSTPFLAEIRIFSFNFAPKGWAQCNGQLLPINQNQALFSLLGTTYGGDGRVNFALPDFRGRTSVGPSSGISLGQRAGEQAHTLIISELPTHTHVMNASSNPADGSAPQNTRILGNTSPGEFYNTPSSLVALGAGTVGHVGGSQPHNNMQPYLVLNFAIALQGIYPSQN